MLLWRVLFGAKKLAQNQRGPSPSISAGPPDLRVTFAPVQRFLAVCYGLTKDPAGSQARYLGRCREPDTNVGDTASIQPHYKPQKSALRAPAQPPN